MLPNLRFFWGLTPISAWTNIRSTSFRGPLNSPRKKYAISATTNAPNNRPEFITMMSEVSLCVGFQFDWWHCTHMSTSRLAALPNNRVIIGSCSKNHLVGIPRKECKVPFPLLSNVTHVLSSSTKLGDSLTVRNQTAEAEKKDMPRSACPGIET